MSGRIRLAKRQTLRGRKNARKARPPRVGAAPPVPPPQPITVGKRDRLLERLIAKVPGGYEDMPRARPVDWNRALVWLRQNPPPEHRSVWP
ncbi:MAG TPA: hypothetical protein VHM01_07400 [Alphaproteobacteria bacterium]|nr:hypothetical protein [Alphaproteobacteria bacterium]